MTPISRNTRLTHAESTPARQAAPTLRLAQGRTQHGRQEEDDDDRAAILLPSAASGAAAATSSSAPVNKGIDGAEPASTTSSDGGAALWPHDTALGSAAMAVGLVAFGAAGAQAVNNSSRITSSRGTASSSDATLSDTTNSSTSTTSGAASGDTGTNGGTTTGTSTASTPVYPESKSQSVSVGRNQALEFDQALFTGSDTDKAPAAIRITDINETNDTQEQVSALTYTRDGTTHWLDRDSVVDAEDFQRLRWDTTQNSGGFFKFEALDANGQAITAAGEQTIEIVEGTRAQVSPGWFVELAEAFLGANATIPYVLISRIEENDSSTGNDDVIVLGESGTRYLKPGDIIASSDYDKVFWDYASNSGGTLYVSPLDENQSPYARDYDTGYPLKSLPGTSLLDRITTGVLTMEAPTLDTLQPIEPGLLPLL